MTVYEADRRAEDERREQKTRQHVRERRTTDVHCWPGLYSHHLKRFVTDYRLADYKHVAFDCQTLPPLGMFGS